MSTVLDALSIAFLVAGWWIAIARFPALPEEVAFGQLDVHTGRDVRYGRWTIFGVPTLQLVILAAVWLISSRSAIPPPLLLHLLCLEVQVCLAAICWRMSETALGRARGLGFWPVLVAGTIFAATIGLALPR